MGAELRGAFLPSLFWEADSGPASPLVFPVKLKDNVMLYWLQGSLPLSSISEVQIWGSQQGSALSSELRQRLPTSGTDIIMWQTPPFQCALLPSESTAVGVCAYACACMCAGIILSGRPWLFRPFLDIPPAVLCPV